MQMWISRVACLANLPEIVTLLHEITYLEMTGGIILQMSHVDVIIPILILNDNGIPPSPVVASVVDPVVPKVAKTIAHFHDCPANG